MEMKFTTHIKTTEMENHVAHDFRTRTTAYPFGLVSRSGWLIHFLLINWSPTLLRVCHLSHSSSWPQLWRFDPCVSLGRGVQGLPLHSPSPTYRSYPAAAWAPWWWITSAPCSPHQPIQSSFQWRVRGGGWVLGKAEGGLRHIGMQLSHHHKHTKL